MTVNMFLELPGGLKMPAFGLGTWQAKDEDELASALNAALELGYRHIDTAAMYLNEQIIGKVLKQWLDTGKIKREDLWITTKLPHYGLHPDKVEPLIKESLEKLQLDYVDLYLIHNPVHLMRDEEKGFFKTNADGSYVTLDTDHVGIWKKMEEQVDKGRARSIGLSNFNIRQIDRILKNSRIKPANLQVELHLHLQQPELVDFCHKNGVTVVAYSPLGTPGYNKAMEGYGIATKEIPDILGDPVVAKIAKKHSKTPAQIAIRFLLDIGTAPIPKSVTAKRLKENIDVFDFKLDSDDIKVLKALDAGEAGRIIDFRVLKGIERHPEYPFPI